MGLLFAGGALRVPVGGVVSSARVPRANYYPRSPPPGAQRAVHRAGLLRLRRATAAGRARGAAALHRAPAANAAAVEAVAAA